jgi:hypothetical protein
MEALPLELVGYVKSFLFGQDWVNAHVLNKRWNSVSTKKDILEKRKYHFDEIAKRDAQQLKTDYGISRWDFNTMSRGRHVIINGVAGSGKSVLMQKLADQRTPVSVNKPGSGKTTLLNEIATNKVSPSVRKIYLSCKPEAYGDDLIKNSNAFTEKIWGAESSGGYLLKLAQQELNSRTNNEEFPETIVFIDDADDQPAFFKSANLQRFLMTRSPKLSIVVTSHQMSSIPKDILRFFTTVVTFSTGSVKDTKTLYNERGGFYSGPGIFRHTCDGVIRDNRCIVFVSNPSLNVVDVVYWDKVYDVPKKKCIQITVNK